MARYEELLAHNAERELAHLGALAARAEKAIAQAEENAHTAKAQVQKLQQEIERLYMILGEPLIIDG